jgi:tetratricopeptide (TPR) repeat protein
MKRLRQAGDYLQKGLPTAFYEELHRSLLGYVSDKLTMDMAEQSKENIAAALQARGVSEGLATEFNELLDACEFARYAPEAPHEAMNENYQKALSVISAIDTSMSKRPAASSKTLALLLLLLLPLGARAAESYPDSLWRVGVEAYTAGDYATALSAWEGVRDTGLQSQELSYNLGNAYFKTGETARAILWYERALKADPSDADAAYNLAFAQSLTQDRIDTVPEFFLEAGGRKMCWLLPSNTWAVLSLVFLAITLALALLFLLGPTRRTRKLGFFIGIVALLCTFLCWDFAQWQWSDARKQDTAILMRPVSAVKSSPSADSGKDLFILHEGTKVNITDGSMRQWKRIRVADGKEGWVETSQIEVI